MARARINSVTGRLAFLLSALFCVYMSEWDEEEEELVVVEKSERISWTEQAGEENALFAFQVLSAPKFSDEQYPRLPEDEGCALSCVCCPMTPVIHALSVIVRLPVVPRMTTSLRSSHFALTSHIVAASHSLHLVLLSFVSPHSRPSSLLSFYVEPTPEVPRWNMDRLVSRLAREPGGVDRFMQESGRLIQGPDPADKRNYRPYEDPDKVTHMKTYVTRPLPTIVSACCARGRLCNWRTQCVASSDHVEPMFSADVSSSAFSGCLCSVSSAVTEFSSLSTAVHSRARHYTACMCASWLCGSRTTPCSARRT